MKVSQACVSSMHRNRFDRMRAPARRNVPRLLAAVIVLACAPDAVRAQLGTGWIPTNFSKRIHLDDTEGLQTFSWTASKSVCSPTVCADYNYNAGRDIETFRIFDSRSNRSEIRLQNDYSTGIHQFEGYVTFYEPLHNESLFQIFGNSGAAATYAMMRGYRDNGGEIRVVSPANVIASSIYGQEVRINMIHLQNQWSKWYVNGQLVLTKSESDTEATNYWKYGVYGTTSGNVPAVVQWRAVRTFRDGVPPEIISTPPGAYEAENALLSGAVVANNQAGYTGAGFADYINPASDYIQWTVDTQDVGLYDLRFRYALESGDRPLEIQVNGQTVNPSFSFPATGAWTTWAEATIPAQLLSAGTNTIRATATGFSGPNVDHLLVSTVATGPRVLGDYNGNGVVDAADFVLWRNSAGQTGASLAADGSGLAGVPDGVVDRHDFIHWRANFGKTLPSASSSSSLAHAAVPEPGALYLMLLALPLFVHHAARRGVTGDQSGRARHNVHAVQ